MNPPDLARLQQLFDEARALHGAARAAFVERTCSSDDDLRRLLEELLAADGQTGPLDAGLPGLRSVAALRPPADPGRVGVFRIVRQLGRGGMGIVYLGERDDGQFDQRVAIKVVDAASADVALRQRFLDERRILAGLRHPNIANLIDGGVLDDGRPFLVLEYVEGVPITQFCDDRRLDVDARLRLFVSVCDAVQHAHSRLVIHRDLKPANILVDADGRVHLLDFGIAQLLGREGAPAHDLRQMTPAYASPEQLRGDRLSVASDVFSLGILLRELLAGAGVGPVPGDLGSIVRVALAHDEAARYESVTALRDEIVRFTTGQAVLAHDGGRRYRTRRFVRRHRVAVAAAMVAAFALVLGAGTAAWQALLARQERDRAEVARGEAEALAVFMAELFRSGEQDEGDARADVTAADLLRRGIARADELADRPLLQARLLQVIGRMSLDIGRYGDADSLLRRAAALQQAHGSGGDLSTTLLLLSDVAFARGVPDSAVEHATRALALRRMLLPADDPGVAEAVHELGIRLTGAAQEQRYREALAMLERRGADVERQVRLLHDLTTHLRRRGVLEHVVATDREALRRAEAAFGSHDYRTGQAMVHLADQLVYLEPDDAAADSLYANGMRLIEARFGTHSTRLLPALYGLAALHDSRARHAEAEVLLRRAYDIRRAASGGAHPGLAADLRRIALQVARQERYPEAEALALHSLQHAERAEAGWRLRGGALQALAEVYHLQGDWKDARAMFEAALALYPNEGVFLGEALRDYGRLLLQQHEWAHAEEVLLRSVALLERHYGGADHPNLLESRRAVAELYGATGRTDLVAATGARPGRYVAY